MLFRRGVSCHCMPPCLNLSGCMGLSVCVSSNKQGSFFLRVTGNSCRRLFCLFNCCWDTLMGLQATMLTLKRLMSVFKNRWYCNTNGSMALDILTNVNCAD